jgi:hypothetical protein
LLPVVVAVLLVQQIHMLELEELVVVPLAVPVRHLVQRVYRV